MERVARSSSEWPELASDAREGGRETAGGDPYQPFLKTTCWRSSTGEHLICNQAVVGSIPIASFEDEPREVCGMPAERYPSGQREQTVNLPASAYGGSNPPLSIIPPGTASVRVLPSKGSDGTMTLVDAGIAQLVRASAFQAEGRGFESRFPLPLGSAGETNAQVAQSAEHVLGKDEVGGSIPLLGFHSAGRAPRRRTV